MSPAFPALQISVDLIVRVKSKTKYLQTCGMFRTSLFFRSPLSCFENYNSFPTHINPAKFGFFALSAREQL